MLTGAALVFGILLVVAACGGDDGAIASDDDPDGNDRRPIGGTYIATAISESGQPRALIDGTTIRLRLEQGALTAHAGCNTIGGDYTIERQVLRVDAVSMTEMGCDPARHDQDQWLADLVSSAPTLEPIDDGFVLRANTTEITFVDRAVVEPDVDLIGTTWLVDGFIEGRGPNASVSSTSHEAMLVFDGNGFVTGHDGCNDFGFAGEAGQPPTQGLRYEVDENEIAFSGAAVTTDKACPDVETDRFWAVLSGSVTWEIDGSRLTLHDDAGHGVSFNARTWKSDPTDHGPHSSNASNDRTIERIERIERIES